ncbi:hypothetical protein [Streptomyces xiamenensis]|uniref:hypothetical protein n=1 Tax=Streptomyces xiamenensis TaxID=408015 RepID=UPI003D729A00
MGTGEKVDGGRTGRKEFSTDNCRTITGVTAVIVGDVVIGAVALIAVFHADGQAQAAFLASAFTAITGITTAYFGIKAVSNTAQKGLEHAGGRRRRKRPRKKHPCPPGEGTGHEDPGAGRDRPRDEG